MDFNYIMRVNLLIFCIIMGFITIDLDELEIEDSDMRAKTQKLIKKYFPNKYKFYSKNELRNFFVELHLGLTKLPSIKEMKNWSY